VRLAGGADDERRGEAVSHRGDAGAAGRRFSLRPLCGESSSMAPLAPMEWPVEGLVDLTNCEAREPKTWGMAAASVTVVDLVAGTVGV